MDIVDSKLLLLSETGFLCSEMFVCFVLIFTQSETKAKNQSRLVVGIIEEFVFRTPKNAWVGNNDVLQAI